MFHFKKKRNYPEREEQTKFFKYLKRDHPDHEVVCFSIFNEGKRTPGQLAILLAAGLQPGIPDTFCSFPNKFKNGLYIEFKYGSGKLSEAQIKRISHLERMNYQCNVCYLADDAIAVFEQYISNI